MSVLELRQYTLKPGRRDGLIALFEREFVESQEAHGMELIGTFRDASDGDRFVWLRRFADMEARARALAAFYGGPVWKAHREEANATMIDSDNVLLLKPAWAGADFANTGARGGVGATGPAPGSVVAAIHSFDAPVTQDFIAAWRAEMPGRIERASGTLVAALVTEPAANTFPALPVREGENVFVPVVVFAGAPPAFDWQTSRTPSRIEILRLVPTARSRLHA